MATLLPAAGVITNPANLTGTIRDGKTQQHLSLYTLAGFEDAIEGVANTGQIDVEQPSFPGATAFYSQAANDVSIGIKEGASLRFTLGWDVSASRFVISAGALGTNNGLEVNTAGLPFVPLAGRSSDSAQIASTSWVKRSSPLSQRYATPVGTPVVGTLLTWVSFNTNFINYATGVSIEEDTNVVEWSDVTNQFTLKKDGLYRFTIQAGIRILTVAGTATFNDAAIRILVVGTPYQDVLTQRDLGNLNAEIALHGDWYYEKTSGSNENITPQFLYDTNGTTPQRQIIRFDVACKALRIDQD